MLRILVIRRDNIGDLICTTPFIRALRHQLPTARIDALVTDYNAAVLAGNPDLSMTYSYQKAKHRNNESYAGVYLRRFLMVMQLRKERYDLAVLPGGAQVSALRFARLCGARRTIVRRDSDANQHEVEHCCTLLTDLGLNFETPRLVLSSPMSMPSQSASGQPLIGLHISARKPSQRWPSEFFVQFVRDCHKETGATFLLFWSPGKADNPLHPGDDEKALEILDRCSDLPVVAVPSQTLPALIAGLARCTHVICSDGGAMHIAAGLGKPIICFFGNSKVDRWYPWGVPYEVLQKPTLNVSDVSVEEALLAFRRLCDRISHETPSSGTQHVASSAGSQNVGN